ncbi:plasmid pRiA4b ORF-3 family protein [soil metagenome]
MVLDIFYIYPMATDEIIQLKITLEGSSPPIWRRLLIEKNNTFEQLHYAIQIAFGWENGHLHDFRIADKVRIMEIMEDDLGFDPGFGRMQVLNEEETILGDHLTTEKQRIQYQYDFGDSWYHTITVEKFLPRELGRHYPTCIKGKLNTPPEDVGGIWGFYDFVEAMANKKHPEHKEMNEWYSGPYDPEYFDMEAINEELVDFWKEEFGK